MWIEERRREPRLYMLFKIVKELSDVLYSEDWDTFTQHRTGNSWKSFKVWHSEWEWEFFLLHELFAFSSSYVNYTYLHVDVARPALHFTLSLSPVRLSSTCRLSLYLSVTFVHPAQATENLGNVLRQ